MLAAASRRDAALQLLESASDLIDADSVLNRAAFGVEMVAVPNDWFWASRCAICSPPLE